MLRRSVRVRKEFLFRKAQEGGEAARASQKTRLRSAIEQGRPIPSDLRGGAANKLKHTLDLDDEKTAKFLHSHVDDEYATAGVEPPKIIITTSRSPSSRLQSFAKEMKLILPGAQRVNRGGYVIADLVALCKKHNFSDLLLIHECRGKPDGLVVCHMPHGPTVYFSMSDVVLRHDLPDKPATMPQVTPHLIFENFSSPLGERISSVLRFLFPPTKPDSQRLMCFVNDADRILFRHHTWAYDKSTPEERGAEAADDKPEQPRDARPAGGRKKRTTTGGSEEVSSSTPSPSSFDLVEVGPRFTLRPYRVELGTADMRDVEVEWALRSFQNTKKEVMAAPPTA
eukprot:GHVT01032982.1.p1 GENE.GHVT01032982.1~~GHVT01032982.1.p1  ORF type:complete len:369 (+),score=86.90 GHVT01032982.1:88-1107(+)